jgi:hypothetical protein
MKLLIFFKKKDAQQCTALLFIKSHSVHTDRKNVFRKKGHLTEASSGTRTFLFKCPSQKKAA